MFSSRLPLAGVIELCRVLRHYLAAGLTLNDVFRQQAATGRGDVRPVAARVSAELQQGGDLETALKNQVGVFPPLLVALASVGEQTGMLPEVFAELEKYYVREQQLRRQFLVQTAWPLFQFLAAVFVMAGVIFVFGLIPQASGPFALHFDPLGLGLSGATRGGGLPGGGVRLAARSRGAVPRRDAPAAAASGRGRDPVADAGRRPVPASTGFGAVLPGAAADAGDGDADRAALKLSFRATDNAAFTARLDGAQAVVKRGGELTPALAGTGLFPTEFQHILAVAEESGRLTEVLRQEADHYHEEAGRRLTALTVAMTVLVWLGVAGFIIFAVFRIFLAYLDLLNQVS